MNISPQLKLVSQLSLCDEQYAFFYSTTVSHFMKAKYVYIIQQTLLN